MLRLKPQNQKKTQAVCFFDIGLSNIFLDTSPQGRVTKAKINKWVFCIAKETINQRKPTELEEILANHISYKVLKPKIYKELVQINSDKTTPAPFRGTFFSRVGRLLPSRHGYASLCLKQKQKDCDWIPNSIHQHKGIADLEQGCN